VSVAFSHPRGGLAHELTNGTLPAEASPTALYSQYSHWYKDYSKRDPERMMTQTAFGRKIKDVFSEDGAITFKKSNGVRRYAIDKPQLIESLAEKYLLDPADCLVGTGCLIADDTIQEV
jgi:hypothetical protein